MDIQYLVLLKLRTRSLVFGLIPNNGSCFCQYEKTGTPSGFQNRIEYPVLLTPKQPFQPMQDLVVMKSHLLKYKSNMSKRSLYT